MTALEVTGLSVEAGGATVVEDLDLVLTAGDKVGMVGRNGAGKTSTLKVLAGEGPVAAGPRTGRGGLGSFRKIPGHYPPGAASTAAVYAPAPRGAADLHAA